MNSRKPGMNIKLTSYDELLGIRNEESSIDITLEKIMPFRNHPFKVLDDEKMADLVESIRENGILSPVLVRPIKSNVNDDRYEMISGHRRMHAAALVGLTEIPAIIRDMDDDMATIYMVDANIQREELLPSERAYAFRMKMEAMSRQGARTDLTSGPEDPKLTTEVIGEQAGMKSRQVKRYIRLTYLTPELMEMVDQKRLQINVAVEVSYLLPQLQRYICEYIKDNGVIKMEQVKALRKASERARIKDQAQTIRILNENLPGREPRKKVILYEENLRKYFPEEYTLSEMQEVIIQLLEEWMKLRK